MPSLEFLKLYAQAHGVEFRVLPVQKRRRQEKYALYHDGRYTPRFNSLIAGRDHIEYHYEWQLLKPTPWLTLTHEEYITDARNLAIRDHGPNWRENPSKLTFFLNAEFKLNWAAEIIIMLPASWVRGYLPGLPEWLAKNTQKKYQFYSHTHPFPEINFESAKDASNFKLVWMGREPD